MITAHVERLSDTLEELKPLFVPHHAELALYQEKMPLAPKYPLYLELEAKGRVLYVTLRDAGKIVAYFVGFHDTGLHYSETMTLQMDIFWLHPDYRDEDSLTEVEAHMLCLQLFTKVRDEAKRRGVKVWHLGSKFHKAADRVFEELGLAPSETYYSQWIAD